MFSKTTHSRINFVFVVIAFFVIAIIGKVFYIQVFQYKKLNSLAEGLWSRNLPLKADRGRILDRNGKVLATNITTTSLVLIPNQIKDKEAVSKDIAEILGVSYEVIYEHASKRSSIERVHPEGRQLSYEIAEKIKNLNYEGVYLLKESKRYYPYNEVLSHTLGYVGIDNQGLSGIELEYNDYLTGSDGAIKYFSDGKGNRLSLNEVYQEPISGMDVALTIDIDLQLAIENELNNVVSKYNPDSALILAMDPNTSEVLGMASRPTFNSNHYEEASTDVINRNLPIWMTYEPGSTFKIITLAASLEEKTINLFEDHYHDSGSIHVDGARIKCWKAGGHGSETFLQVVENSCNPGFVVMGQKLGKERLFNYINNFGFGSKTGIDLNGESSGIMFNMDKVGPVELATTSFGQGISVTPIQQVTGVSAAINGGILYKPYIVKRILEPETKSVIVENTKKEVRRVISEDTSKLVRFTLESVVANGTGRNAYIENYRVGGKTGTAQKVQDGKYMVGNYIVSFIGFMPADNPQIVVYVAIDNPKGITQYGGTVSAPVAKTILKEAISIFDIKPSKEVMPREYNWLDTKYYILPNVEGMTIDEAKKTLKGYGIVTSGTGNKVLYQEPKGEVYVKEGSTIRIYLTN
ncbi:MAG: stage V sporulation protein D [Bacilli bacterium]